MQKGEAAGSATPRAAGRPLEGEEGRTTGTPDLVAGVVVDDRYVLEERVGRGGHATVFAAFDRRLRSLVALKLLRPELSGSTAVRRLQREAALSRPVHHPNLLRVFDVGETREGLVYLVCELVRGETLADRIRRGPLPVDEAVRIVSGVLSALERLHAHGVLHRDVKPSNVLLSMEGDVKLSDFGVALSIAGAETRLTGTESLIGTLEYLSPEQALGEPVGPRSDLFSVGVMLFESLTGALPYQGSTSVETLVRRLSQPPPRPSSRRPGLEPWIDRLVLRLLERRPADRYPEAADVLADLREHRVRRSLTRRSLAALLAAAAALAAVAIPVVWARTHRPRFDRLVHSEEGITLAVDRHGRELWRRGDIAPAFSATHLRGRPRAPAAIASFGVTDDRWDLEDHRSLQLFDQETGRPLKTLTLDTEPQEKLFAGFSPNYGLRATSLDVDGDGANELFVAWTHTYEPSFAGIVFPELGTYRALFMGSGHHQHPVLADLDGDGRRELLLTGVNNQMGWYPAVVALPTIAAQKPTPFASGRSPDLLGNDPLGFVWYALMPQDACPPSGPCLEVDAARRVLRSTGPREWTLDFDGFPVRTDSPLDPARREDARRSSLEHLRGAWRQIQIEQTDSAIAGLELAAADAADADDPVLVEWLERCHAIFLARAGRIDEAEHEFGRLIAEKPELEYLLTFDAATAFHFAGSLERAVDWYLRCLFEVGSLELTTRPHWETMEGLVLALDSLGRLEEADPTLNRFARIYRLEASHVETYRRYAAWRQGVPVALPESTPSRHSLDLDPYLQLEARYDTHDDATELLERVDRELSVSSFTTVPLRSLRAVLLQDLGRDAEARAEARRALDELEVQSQDRLLPRTLRPLVERRALRVGARQETLSRLQAPRARGA